MTKLLLVFLGSGVGGALRYAVSGWVQSWTSPSFPTGTLAVNVAGCLAIGFLGTALSGALLVREEYRVAILVGLLGGFTTFSAFGRETFALSADRETALAVLNVLLSVVLGVGAVWLGTRLAERLYGV